MNIFDAIANYLFGCCVSIVALVGIAGTLALLFGGISGALSTEGAGRRRGRRPPYIDVPAGHKEMEAQAWSEIVNQTFSGRGQPVSGHVVVYEGDDYETQAYAAWLDKFGDKNGNDVDVVRLRGRRP